MWDTGAVLQDGKNAGSVGSAVGEAYLSGKSGDSISGDAVSEDEESPAEEDRDDVEVF
jgi:hypothetical protein